MYKRIFVAPDSVGELMLPSCQKGLDTPSLNKGLKCLV